MWKEIGLHIMAYSSTHTLVSVLKPCLLGSAVASIVALASKLWEWLQ